MSNNRQETTAGVSVSEMARMVGLSRQRFHQLMQAGVFPQPQRNEGRPFFDEPTQQVCLEVRRRNCGVNGQAPHADLLDGLKALGLASVTAADVGAAVKTLFPQGTAGMDEGEVIKTVFLHLKYQNTADKV